MLLVGALAVSACQAPSSGTLSASTTPQPDDFANDPRISQAMVKLEDSVIRRCDMYYGSLGPRGCVTEATTAALPNGPEMFPYCQGFAAGVDESICMSFGAAAIEMVTASGADDKISFVQLHGPERSRSIEAAGAEVIAMLQKECSGDVPQCLFKEGVRRLRSTPQETQECGQMQGDWRQVNCLMTDHIVSFLNRAAAKA
jgi:hypothetical protein